MMSAQKKDVIGLTGVSSSGKYEDSFLSDRGKEIYNLILGHCKALGVDNSIDVFELAMLANSFDKYAVNAEYCRDYGDTQQPEKGGWDQIRPEYTVMKNEYQNILKHSAKFGLNPGDRAKIFGKLKPKEKPDPSQGLD